VLLQRVVTLMSRLVGELMRHDLSNVEDGLVPCFQASPGRMERSFPHGSAH
jgi:hypothetical protein